MKYKKLNNNWNAEPNAPDAKIEKGSSWIELSFQLNPFLFDYIDENDSGFLEFMNVYKYRIGSPNDEGYYTGDFRYINEELPWGEFYELFDSGWETNFPRDAEVENEELDKTQLRHFIFFFRDETFECLASDYCFRIQFDKEKFYRNKYPDGLIKHYLAMYSVNREGLSNQDFETQNKMYIEFEGVEEFQKLRREVIKAKEEEDLDWFLKVAIAEEILNIDLNNLNRMLESIKDFKCQNQNERN